MKLTMALVALSSCLHSNPTPVPQTATIAFVGDVNFTGRIGEMIAVSGTAWPFEKVKDILSKADYRICNLENPAGRGGAKYCEKSVYFKANPKYLDALTDAGFNLVSLANNHALDYGPEVLSQTCQELDKRGIKYIGIRSNNKEEYVPKVAIINGLKIAFYGYCNACPEEFGPRSNTAGVNVGMKRLIKNQISLLKAYFPDIDFIVAIPHWGTEYAGVDKNQEFTSKALLEAGVDLVVGAHPHVLQKVSSFPYADGGYRVVAYSLGNFLFPMKWKVSLDSAILSVDLVKNNGKKDIRWSFIPISLDSNRPVPVDPDTERFRRDNIILRNGYEYPEDRRWPLEAPWK